MDPKKTGVSKLAESTPKYEDQQKELASIQHRSSRTTDNSLETSRRIMALTRESEDIGSKTLATLEFHTEQLTGIEKAVDQLSADMRIAEENLTGLEKCCGLCILPWKRMKKDKKLRAKTDSTEKSDTILRGTELRVSKKMQSGPMIRRITGDAREEEMDQNLMEVSKGISVLKDMAENMNLELEKGNKITERVTMKVEINNIRVANADRRTKELL